jgi:hypothetical protein
MSPPAVPETVVAPVFVMAEPASTAKFEELPSGTGEAAFDEEFPVKKITVTATTIAIAGKPNLTKLELIFFVSAAMKAPPW